MKTFQAAWRRIKRILLYIHALAFSIIARRRIDISEQQISGQGNFWQFSYKARISLPDKRINLEFLKAAPANTKFYKTASAIKIAEEVCKEFFIPPTPAFIRVDGDTVVVIIKEN